MGLLTCLYLFLLVWQEDGGVLANYLPEFSPKEGDMVIQRLVEGPATTVGSVIYRFKGTDRDGDALTFGIGGGDTRIGGVFRLDRVSRTEANLFLTKELDRETVDQYVIEATLTDGRTRKPNSQILMFILVDVNDNSPTFKPFNSTVVIPENGVVPQVILEVEATDPDEGPNGNVTFGLELDAEDAGTFNMTIVNGKVVLYLLESLNYEKKRNYKVVVVARDNPIKPSDTRQTRAVINIEVKDMDDTWPVFVSTPPLTKIREDVVIGTRVCQVKAVDGDTGVNGRISYELLTERDKFEIVPDTGLLKTRSRLNYELSAEGSYTLRIKAVEVDSLHVPKPWVETSIVVGLIDVDESPKFRNESYQGTVPENSPVGFPITLKGGLIPEVYDNDLGGKSLIRLSVEGDGGTFAVYPSQGYAKVAFQILVRDPLRLDYERLQEIIFHLIAEDVSRNRTIMIFSISITDVNDNAPEFDRESYLIKIPENPPLGHELLTVKATDRDSGLYGTRGIRFISVKGLGSDQLGLDSVSGKLAVRKVNSTIFDRERYPFIYLTVEARDWMGKGNSNFTMIQVELEDANDNAPIFTKSQLEVEVYENTCNVTLPLRITATDADQPGTNNSQIRFGILSSQSAQLNVNATSGYIHVLQPFDFESLAKDTTILHDGSSNQVVGLFRIPINFTIQAHDLGQPRQFSYTNLTLYILDRNDCPPEFIQHYYNVSIREDLRGNKDILRMIATDGDMSPNYNRVMYQLISSGNGADNLFTVDSSSGVLSTRPDATFDYDVKSEYVIEVSAVDVLGLRSAKNCVINVTVTDVNDKPPRFVFSSGTQQIEDDDRRCGAESGKTYHAKISENSPPGEFIAKLHASDADLNAQLQYTINFTSVQAFKNGSKVDGRAIPFEKCVEYDTREGTLRTGSISFDYEKVDRLRLTVKVEDVKAETSSRQEDVAYVLIDILNVNDKPPVFLKEYYNVTIPENSKVGTVVVRVAARGGDEESSLMRYSFLLPSNANTNMPIIPFEIDSVSGVVSLVSSVDRELTEWINLTVQATDEKSLDHLSSYCSLYVRIQDENDNAPEFTTDTPKEVSINEDTPVGKIIGHVHTRDADTGSFGTVTYRLKEGKLPSNKKFTIDPISGTITLVEAVDREFMDKYELLIEAIDNYNDDTSVSAGVPSSHPNSHRVQKKLIVHVLDVNDEIPQFTIQSVQTPNVQQRNDCYIIKEDFNDAIVSFEVTDGDQQNTQNSKIVTTLGEAPGDQTPFILVNETGNSWEIKMLRDVKLGNYSLTVEARDSGVPPNVVTRQFCIIVEALPVPPPKVKPQFSRKEYKAVVVSPKNKMGASLFELTYTGDRITTDSNLTIVIVSPIRLHLTSGDYRSFTHADAPLFTISPKTGVASLNFDIAENTTTGYFTFVAAILDTAETETDTANVTVYIARPYQQVDLQTNLSLQEAHAQLPHLIKDLEDIFGLSVLIEWSRDGILPQKEYNNYVAFKVSMACELSHQLLSAAELTRLFSEACPELTMIFDKYQILTRFYPSSSYLLAMTDDNNIILPDAKTTYLYFAFLVTCFLTTVLLIIVFLILFCCTSCSRTKGTQADKRLGANIPELLPCTEENEEDC